MCVGLYLELHEVKAWTQTPSDVFIITAVLRGIFQSRTVESDTDREQTAERGNTFIYILLILTKGPAA